jgi:hypothetical protein
LAALLHGNSARHATAMALGATGAWEGVRWSSNALFPDFH